MRRHFLSTSSSMRIRISTSLFKKNHPKPTEKSYLNPWKVQGGQRRIHTCHFDGETVANRWCKDDKGLELIDDLGFICHCIWDCDSSFFQPPSSLKKIYNTLFCNFGSWKLVAHAQVAGEPQEYKSFLSIINRELLKNIRNFLLWNL